MKRLLWLVLFVAAATAIAVVAIPTLYIQPFKPQAADWLARAYALRRAAPLVTAIALPIVVLSAIGLVWLGTLRPRRSSRVPPPQHVGQDCSPAQREAFSPARRRIGPAALAVLRGLTLLVLVGLTGVVTWFCRQNHFEWMFAPPAAVKYVAAKDASKFLTGDEMVMGIEVGGLSPRVSDPPDGLPPRGERHDRDHAGGGHVLNALSHRSGVGVGGGR